MCTDPCEEGSSSTANCAAVRLRAPAATAAAFSIAVLREPFPEAGFLEAPSPPAAAAFFASFDATLAFSFPAPDAFFDPGGRPLARGPPRRRRPPWTKARSTPRGASSCCASATGLSFSASFSAGTGRLSASPSARAPARGADARLGLRIERRGEGRGEVSGRASRRLEKFRICLQGGSGHPRWGKPTPHAPATTASWPGSYRWPYRTRAPSGACFGPTSRSASGGFRASSAQGIVRRRISNARTNDSFSVSVTRI